MEGAEQDIQANELPLYARIIEVASTLGIFAVGVITGIDKAVQENNPFFVAKGVGVGAVGAAIIHSAYKITERFDRNIQ